MAFPQEELLDSSDAARDDNLHKSRQRPRKHVHVDIYVPARMSGQPAPPPPPPPPPPLSPPFLGSSPSTTCSTKSSMLRLYQSQCSPAGGRSPMMSSRGSVVTTPTASLSVSDSSNSNSNMSISMQDLQFSARALRESTSPHPSPLSRRRKGLATNGSYILKESPEASPGYVPDCVPSRRRKRIERDGESNIPEPPATSPPLAPRHSSPSSHQRQTPPRPETGASVWSSAEGAASMPVAPPGAPPFMSSPPQPRPNIPRSPSPRHKTLLLRPGSADSSGASSWGSGSGFGANSANSNDQSVPSAPPSIGSPPQSQVNTSRRSPQRETPPRPDNARRSSNEMLMRATMPPQMPCDSPSRHPRRSSFGSLVSSDSKRQMSSAATPGAVQYYNDESPPSPPMSSPPSMMNSSMSMMEAKALIRSRSSSRLLSPGVSFENDDAEDSVLVRRRIERSRRRSLREHTEVDDGVTILTDNNDTTTSSSSGSSVTSGYTTVSSITGASCFTPGGRLRSPTAESTPPNNMLPPSGMPRHIPGPGRLSPMGGHNFGRNRRRSHPLQNRHHLNAEDAAPLIRPGLTHEAGRRHLANDNRARINEKLAQMERDEEAREERRRKALETARMRVITSRLAVVEHGTESTAMLYPPKDTTPLVAGEGGDEGNGENGDDNDSESGADGNAAAVMLAVATVVSTDAESNSDDDNVSRSLPKAVEYDPESKPPVYLNRRFRLYFSMGCTLLMIVISLSVWLIVTRSRRDSSKSIGSSTPAPSEAPFSAKEQIYRDVFAEVVGDVVYEAGSAHDMAADWIVNHDPMALPPDHDRLVQRFLLAFFYYNFSENGTKPWKSCNPPQEGETAECSLAVHGIDQNDNFFHRPKPGFFRWLSEEHECSWAGLICSDSFNPKVFGLDIAGQDLTGTLPTELTALSFLQALHLPFNNIKGTLPPEYSQLKHLISIELHYNALTGTIPTGIFTRSGGPMQVINLGSNMIGGTIATEIGISSTLKAFFVFDNLMVGEIPSEIGRLSVLERSWWQKNSFTGTLPSEVFASLDLSMFLANNNYIIGTIPSEVGMATRLEALMLGTNDLKGSIPEVIYELTSLNILHVHRNSLTGTISTRIGELTQLTDLRVSENPFVGAIPSELASLRSAALIWTQLTQMTGSMPLELCNYVNAGSLQVLQTDCFPPDNPTIPCPCCHACCDRSNGICEDV